MVNLYCIIPMTPYDTNSIRDIRVVNFLHDLQTRHEPNMKLTS